MRMTKDNLKPNYTLLFCWKMVIKKNSLPNSQRKMNIRMAESEIEIEMTAEAGTNGRHERYSIERSRDDIIV